MYFAGIDGVAERFRCVSCGARPWRFCTGLSHADLELRQAALRRLEPAPA
jgi:hypothetical protein